MWVSTRAHLCGRGSVPVTAVAHTTTGGHLTHTRRYPFLPFSFSPSLLSPPHPSYSLITYHTATLKLSGEFAVLMEAGRLCPKTTLPQTEHRTWCSSHRLSSRVGGNV